MKVTVSRNWYFSCPLGVNSFHMEACIKLGVPYEKGYERIANQELVKQAKEISDNLKKDKINVAPDKEVIAIIAYLQRQVN